MPHQFLSTTALASPGSTKRKRAWWPPADAVFEGISAHRKAAKAILGLGSTDTATIPCTVSHRSLRVEMMCSSELDNRPFQLAQRTFSFVFMRQCCQSWPVSRSGASSFPGAQAASYEESGRLPNTSSWTAIRPFIPGTRSKCVPVPRGMSPGRA